MLWENFLSPEFGAKFQGEVHLFLKIPKFCYNTVQDRSKEALTPKPNLIGLAVSIEHRLVTGTDRHRVARVNILSVKVVNSFYMIES